MSPKSASSYTDQSETIYPSLPAYGIEYQASSRVRRTLDGRKEASTKHTNSQDSRTILDPFLSLARSRWIVCTRRESRCHLERLLLSICHLDSLPRNAAVRL
jgi:hypothetical protein